jgi:hypothetical protein
MHGVINGVVDYAHLRTLPLAALRINTLDSPSRKRQCQTQATG